MKAASEIENRLLLGLPRRELEQLKPRLERVSLGYKDILVDDEASLDHVYFPNSGVVSVIGVYSTGETAELASIGREGTTGFQEILGARASGTRLLVQIEGTAMRLRRSAYDRAVKELPGFRDLMYTYLHAFLQQLMLAGACNGTHSVNQRLARWLLMMHDRSNGDTLPITQDLIAEMLGVHRPTATKALGLLDDAGVIRAGRGRIDIVNRDGLTGHACECYLLIRTRTANLLPKTYSPRK